MLARLSVSRAATPAAAVSRAEYLQMSGRGEALLAQGRPREAEEVFRRLLVRMGGSGRAETEAYDQAITRQRLGRCLADRSLVDEAEAEYRKALGILNDLAEKTRDVENAIGALHGGLGDLALARRRLSEAREHHEKGLEIHRRLGDRRGVAVGEGQLGTLALEEGDLAEARRRYVEALATFRELREPATEAVIHHQLGRLAKEEASRAAGEERAQLLDEAAAEYKQSLQLVEMLGDRQGAGASANQLAIVEQMAGRLGRAARWYEKALVLEKSAGRDAAYVKTASNLAVLLQEAAELPADDPRRRDFAGRDLLAEAEKWALASLEIEEAIADPSTEIWLTYANLAGIAKTRGNTTAAAAWLRKERRAFADGSGAWERYRARWEPVSRLFALAVKVDEATREPLRANWLARLAETDDWKNLAAALDRVLAGARDADALAEVHHLDRVDYLILTKVLEAIAAAQAPPPD
ncbi:MAG: tetratricopeptide repeat protein [Thermoanaerobaculia bacterium]|nr:tetratricopeptide repeat protein [Thermoanaerobaculia bacterium]